MSTTEIRRGMIKNRLEKANFDSVQGKATKEDLAEVTDKLLGRMEAGFKDIGLTFEKMDHKFETQSERSDHKLVTLINETNHRIDTFSNESRNEFKMVKIEMGAIKSDLEKEISNSRFELLKWSIGAMLINAGIIVALLKFFN